MSLNRLNSEKGKAPASVETDSVMDKEPLNSGAMSGRSEISSSENSGGNFGRITSSASSLFQSLFQPTASEASNVVQNAQQSKGQASTASSSWGSHYQWEEGSSASRHYVQPSCDISEEQSSTEFRSSSVTSPTSIDGEFQSFSNKLNSTIANGEITDFLTDLPPQEDILQLLSSSTLTEAIWDTPHSSYPEANAPVQTLRPNLQDSRFAEFLATDDIVGFLSQEGSVYTEEVWGTMLWLVQEARKEIAETKGKESDRNQNGNAVAVERLKMIQAQLRSKL